ncbi:MAG: Rpn family recombination-promoting nuclease/putative transposase [Treponema sp.]|nr:Rpn family recombination-promoting nuclease/putative transposase [Treponema sp.]MCL2251875.1 Rpn family recombination-promoting nuclease/putative transposase [Treponema sp.]
MTKLEYTFKTDTLFKILFVKNPDLLKDLVSELLQISKKSISRFEITNPEMPSEAVGDKFCRLDINMMVNDQRITLEIQVRDEGDYPERVLFQWSRVYSNSLESGSDYIKLPRTVIISIIYFNQLECKEFHSEFRPLEITRHEELTDKMTLHFFELKKLPDDITDKDMLKLWLALFKANTQEELDKIKSLKVSIMEEAINAYNTVTVSPEFKELERLRSMARHNEASALRFEREQTTIEIAKNALQMNLPIETISKLTGLTIKEIEEL